jgi:hypothetical protein
VSTSSVEHASYWLVSSGDRQQEARSRRHRSRVHFARRRRQRGLPRRLRGQESDRVLLPRGLAELNGEGIEVIGISPDKPAKLAKFRDAEELNFPLLSDPEKATLEAWGTFGEKKMYGKTVQGVIRSAFLVDEAGKIEVAQYNVRATGHVAKLRRDLSV